MNEKKMIALKELIDTPKNLSKLARYERKIAQAALSLLFDCRTLIINTHKTNKHIPEVARIFPSLKVRVDNLIDRAREIIIRIKPGTDDKRRKLILDNAIIFDFIIFSKCWDIKDDLTVIESDVLFSSAEDIMFKMKALLQEIQAIDELFTEKEHSQNNIRESEDVYSSLYAKFSKELETAERAGALKELVKLRKPKLFGRDEYYEQLQNIILKIVFSLSDGYSDKPISTRDIVARLKNQFHRVSAELADINKAIQALAENGLLILKEDYQGLTWIHLTPPESEANVILSLAKEKGFVTLEEVMLHTNWPLEKASLELKKFVQAGCAIEDTSYSSGTKYYFPGLN